MANIPLKTIKFPDLANTYTIPEVSTDLTASGKAADAAETGRQIGLLKADLSDTIVPEINQRFAVLAGSQVASGTGEISANTSTSRSDYTELKCCEYITLENATFINCCFYDKDKNYVCGTTNVSVNIHRPVNAFYIIFTCFNSAILNAELHLHNVPTSITDINDALSEINASTLAEQVDVSYGVIANSKVTPSTGVISSESNMSISDYVDISECSSFALISANKIINYCLYDANKSYVTGSSTYTSGTVITPRGDAKYVIFTMGSAYILNVTVRLFKVPTFGKSIVRQAPIFTDYISLGKMLLENVIGVSKFPNNLINKTDCVNNAFVNFRDGNLAFDTGYFATGYIPVVEGTEYKANHGRNYAWYDENKAYLSGDLGTGIQNGITAPENAAYIRFTINKSSDGISNPLDLYFANIADYSSSVVIPGLSVDDITVKPWCYGKTINWIGDSIVDGPDFDEVVCNALGLTKLTTDGVDGGINGSTIALKADGTDGRNALCLRYSAMPNNADIIAVSCGTNDFQYAWCPIGDIESASNSTFYGALKTLCEGLINKYPQKLIFFTTPIKRAQAFENGNGGEYTEDGVTTTPFSKNKYGKTLGDYADIIKEVCGYYSIPVLDMYRESLLNPHLTSQQSMFDNVKTHPNSTGQKIMARRVAGWMTQLGYIIN